MNLYYAWQQSGGVWQTVLAVAAFVAIVWWQERRVDARSNP